MVCVIGAKSLGLGLNEMDKAYVLNTITAQQWIEGDAESDFKWDYHGLVFMLSGHSTPKTKTIALPVG